MDHLSQSSVTKPSLSTAAPKNEVAIHTVEQIFGMEFELTDEMSAALRALQRTCEANDLDLTEQVQFAFERQTICLKKLATNRRNRRDRKAAIANLSERSWVRSALREMRSQEREGT
jgi:hypothetical protein